MMQNAVRQAITALSDTRENTPEQASFLMDELFLGNVSYFVQANPVLSLVLKDGLTSAQVQTLLLVAYETGKIIGTQMVIDSYVQGTLEENFTPNPID